MKCKIIDIDGIQTRYLYGGSGPLLLLLHPVGTSGDMFCRNIDVLAKDFTVVAPDVLGHGFTGMVDLKGGPPQPAVIDHLGKLVDRLGFTSFCVGGNSYGGLLSPLMYFARPHQVKKIIMIGSASTFHPPDEINATLKNTFANALTAMQNPSWASCVKRLANIVHDPASVPLEVIPIQLTTYAYPDRVDAFKQTLLGMMAAADSKTVRVYHRLEEIKAPTLVICGRNDIRANWQWHEKGVARMPNARLEVFENCGHLPQSEHPDRLNRLIREFILG
ncbi:MAG: alpha/beta hydrolase [Alphaproteobacteria bacterium]|nr:alpha/beta hydrolase [Alphaproteobacteria bacterium]